MLEYIIEKLGWSGAVYFKDATIFLSGFLFGSLLVFLILAYFFLHIHKVDELEKASILKIDYKDKNYYITNPSTLRESVDMLFSFFFMTINPRKKHQLKSSLRERIIVNVLILAIILVLSFGLYLITHILPLPKP